MTKISELDPYDAAGFLHTTEDRARFLSTAIEDGDPVILRKALLSAMRSVGLDTVATAVNVDADTLDREFGLEGDPELVLVLKVVRAMGLRFGAASA